MQSNKILYLHGRPSSHFLHRSMANSLGVDSHFVDEDYRWQDQGFGPLRNVYAWIKNALAYKKYKTYQFILVDGLHFSPVIAKKLGILPKKTVVMSHMGNQLPYFLMAKKIPLYSRVMHRWLLNRYDHVFCEGQMVREMLHIIKPDLRAELHVTFLGPSEQRLNSLQVLKPKFESFTLITVASGPGIDRVFYKGLDLSLQAFCIARKKLPQLNYTIVGEWNKEDIQSMLANISHEDRQNIIFTGHTSAIETYLQEAALCVHSARGDAFPTSTLEAMHAGIPVIVSELTGTKRVIQDASLDLIVTLSPEDLAKKIVWYFQLSPSEKHNLSSQLRAAVAPYTEQQAIQHYKKTFHKIQQLEKSDL